MLSDVRKNGFTSKRNFEKKFGFFDLTVYLILRGEKKRTYFKRNFEKKFGFFRVMLYSILRIPKKADLFQNLSVFTRFLCLKTTKPAVLIEDSGEMVLFNFRII